MASRGKQGGNVSNGDETAGAHDGIRTRDPNLTKIVRYLCATWAKIFDCLDVSAGSLLIHLLATATHCASFICQASGVSGLPYQASRTTNRIRNPDFFGC